jgi:TetR/AcrR family acrAB operon transcriptional repressor
MARKTAQEAAKTRQRIISASVSAFARDGVAHVTLEQIAGQAGVTRGAIYWHFKNKQDLLEKILDEQQHPLEQPIPTGLKFSARWQRLRQALIETASRKDSRMLCESMLHRRELKGTCEPVPMRFHRFRGSLANLLQELLNRAVARGELGAQLNIPVFCELIQHCVAGALIECVQSTVECQRKLSTVLDTLLYLLTNPPAHLCHQSKP